MTVRPFLQRLPFLRNLVILAGAGAAAFAFAPAAANGPTVVELFQSQGCSSCPPANAILNGLADRADLLPLNFSVTYWDQLGWKDSFADPAYTARQWEYARAGGRGNVATPQFIVDGVGVITGSNGNQLANSIAIQSRVGDGPAIVLQGGKIMIPAGKASAPATVWLVRYDPRTRNVKIGRGENGGRVLPHRNVVTGLRRLGAWTGAAATFDQPVYRNAGERSAVIVQQGRGAGSSRRRNSESAACEALRIERTHFGERRRSSSSKREATYVRFKSSLVVQRSRARSLT